MSRVYYKDINNKVRSYRSESGSANARRGLNLTPITKAERDLILNPPPTSRQIISNTLTDILKKMDEIFIHEYEKPIYFHGMGFRGSNSGRYAIGNAILNASTFPNNADTIKLANWRYDCYGKFKRWRNDIVAGKVPPSKFTEAYIERNLPKVEDY